MAVSGVSHLDLETDPLVVCLLRDDIANLIAVAQHGCVLSHILVEALDLLVDDEASVEAVVDVAPALGERVISGNRILKRVSAPSRLVIEL